MPTVSVSAYFGYLRPWLWGGRAIHGLRPLWFRYQIVAEVSATPINVVGLVGPQPRRYVVIGETWTKRAAVLVVDDLRAARTATNRRAQEADRD